MNYYQLFETVKDLLKRTEIPVFELVPKETPLPYITFGKFRHGVNEYYKDQNIYDFHQDIFFFSNARTRKESFEGGERIAGILEELDLAGYAIIQREVEVEVDQHQQGESHAVVKLKTIIQKEELPWMRN